MVTFNYLFIRRVIPDVIYAVFHGMQYGLINGWDFFFSYVLMGGISSTPSHSHDQFPLHPSDYNDTTLSD